MTRSINAAETPTTRPRLAVALLVAAVTACTTVSCTAELPAAPHVAAAENGEPIARWLLLHETLADRLDDARREDPERAVDELEQWLAETHAARTALALEVDVAMLDTVGRTEARYLDETYTLMHRLAALRRSIERDLAGDPRLLARFRRAAMRIEI